MRDQAYHSLQLLVNLHLHSDVKAFRASAEKLEEVIAHYPKMLRMNYDKETEMVKNLVTDLPTSEFTPHVTKLSAKSYIDSLDKALIVHTQCKVD